MRVHVKTSFTFDKTLERIESYDKYIDTRLLNKYGKLGVEALQKATPKKTGLTAASWKYDIVKGKRTVQLNFKNTNIQNGVCVAMVIEYGHATYSGAWVEGRPYIEEALTPVMNAMLDEIQHRRKEGK